MMQCIELIDNIFKWITATGFALTVHFLRSLRLRTILSAAKKGGKGCVSEKNDSRSNKTYDANQWLGSGKWEQNSKKQRKEICWDVFIMQIESCLIHGKRWREPGGREWRGKTIVYRTSTRAASRWYFFVRASLWCVYHFLAYFFRCFPFNEMQNAK